jgi:hypothetical protein
MKGRRKKEKRQKEGKMWKAGGKGAKENTIERNK